MLARAIVAKGIGVNSVNVFRVAVEPESWKEDGEQGGEHVPSGASCLLPVELQRVASL